MSKYTSKVYTMTVETILNELTDEARSAFVAASIAQGVPVMQLIVRALTQASERIVDAASKPDKP